MDVCVNDKCYREKEGKWNGEFQWSQVGIVNFNTVIRQGGGGTELWLSGGNIFVDRTSAKVLRWECAW